MRKGIGEIQEENLNIVEKLNIVIRQIKIFIDNNDVKDFYDFLGTINDYRNVLCNAFSMFGYEKEKARIQYIFDVFDIYSAKTDLSMDSESIKVILEELLNLTEGLLQDKEGKRKTCNCCEEKVYYTRLSDFYCGERIKDNVKEHIPETLNKEEYLCPCCMASDRDRLIVAFLKQLGLEDVIDGEKFLQIAPSPAIEHWINANCPGIVYHSTDLFLDHVTFKSDVQNMSMIEDESYDYFVCSHVLEHVEDDKRAMRELHRILKKDGMGIFLEPIYLDIENIDEEWELPEEENWKRLGQGNYCRSYAKQELIERLEEAGFRVNLLGINFFGEKVFQECGLTGTSALYVLTKREQKLETLIEQRKEKRNILWDKPLVSVILPTYNHEKYVAEAIESVLNQTYDNYEFLVADDGSTDGTVAEILKYEDKIDQIHIFDLNTGGGQVVRFLQSIAKGKYIAMMHSDDAWASDKLMQQVIYLENHSDCVACFTGCKCFGENREDSVKGPFLMSNKKKEEWLRFFYDKGNCLSHPSILIYRDVYSKLLTESHAEMFRQLPDFWMWIKLIQKSEIHIIEKELTFFRVHEEGVNRNTSAHTRENLYRHLVEESYIWYDVIRKMDNGYFLKVFEDRLRKKDIDNEKEVMCEKLFVLLNARTMHTRKAALFYLYEIYQMEDIPQILEQEYGLSYVDIYKISGDYRVKNSD